jgi:hypothetical protein
MLYLTVLFRFRSTHNSVRSLDDTLSSQNMTYAGKFQAYLADQTDSLSPYWTT